MKNLANLAKGGGKKPTPAPTRKAVVKPAPKVVEKPKSKEEIRDEKAKETVEKLLNGVELTPKVEEEVVTPVVNAAQGEGIEWLEEQVSLLTEQNEALRAELLIAKEDYGKLYQKLQGGDTPNGLESETLRQNILFFFTEMQNAYLGFNPQGERYTIAYPERLLPKLIQLFPFLQNYQRF